MNSNSRLQLKLSTANRFRDFSKKNDSNQSQTLDLMLDFFEKNNLSPFETLAPSKVSLENLIKKRIDGVIAILKNIEKTQTKPSFMMLELLMEGQVLSGEKSETKATKKFPLLNEKTREQLEIEINRVQELLRASKKDMEYLLHKVELKGNSFGADYLKLNIPRTEFEQFKIALKHNP